MPIPHRLRLTKHLLKSRRFIVAKAILTNSTRLPARTNGCRWVNVAETCSLASCRLSALQHALHNNPRDAKANALLASYYIDRHQPLKARTRLQTAATSDPRDFVIGKQTAPM